MKYVADSYANYKSTFGLMDFTDLIIRFANEADHLMPPLKICFLDEAQDLSPLQWDIAHKLDEKSERMYVAGDDDQAIYRWAGADVNHFINLARWCRSFRTKLPRPCGNSRLGREDCLSHTEPVSKGLPTSAGTGADTACAGHSHNRYVRG